jgi:hypothetical protein
VPTALADRPAAPPEQPTAGPAGATPAPAVERATRACANCGAPLTDGQDWCLQCGTGAPDSLRTRAPTWRSAAVLGGALAVLVAGAAGAAYAALSKHDRKPRTSVTAVAQAPAAPAAPAVAGAGAATAVQPPSGSAAPTVTGKIGTPTTIKPLAGLGAIKAPKIPSVVSTPKGSIVAPSLQHLGGVVTPTVKIPTVKPRKSTKQAPVPAGEAHPEALLLDTNAASTYNPYAYAATNFGDPSLAIDGDASTGWTALVEPANAPKLAEGLVIDLNTARRLSGLTLVTTTPGMTVQVYGANGATLPASITDPAWVPLSPSLTEGKKRARIKFGGSTAAAQQNAKKPYRFVVLWISQAPASAVGTPAAPGRVSVNELELFARKQ